MHRVSVNNKKGPRKTETSPPSSMEKKRKDPHKKRSKGSLGLEEDDAGSVLKEEVETLAALHEQEGAELIRDCNKRQLSFLEEYSLEFLCNHVHHPVISCFRDLKGRDVRLLTANNALKKASSPLELSLTYLGLIDLMAVTLDNPLYDEQKIKKVPLKIKNIMMDFKSIIGSWGLSDYAVFKQRYELIMRYLRTLAPLFKSSNFDANFISILDTIEREIGRNRLNYEKMTSSTSQKDRSPSSAPKLGPDIQTLVEKSTVTTSIGIDLDIGITAEDDEEDESEDGDDKTIQLSYPELKLKPPPTSSVQKVSLKKKCKVPVPVEVKKRRRYEIASVDDKEPSLSSALNHKTESGLGQFKTSSVDLFGSDSPVLKASGILDKQPKAKPVNTKPCENAVKGRKVTKSVKDTKRAILKPSPQKSSSSSSLTSSPVVVPIKMNMEESPIPKVNAFALLMLKSKELARQKKLSQSPKPQKSLTSK